MSKATSFCAGRARESAQPLAGTAVRGQRYLFLPLRKSLWGSVDLDFSWAPEEVAAFVKAQRRSGTVTRFYHPSRPVTGASLAIVGEKGAVRTRELPAPWHADLDALQALYEWQPEESESQSGRSLIAVCTHGS